MRGHRWTKEENKIIEENLYERDEYIKDVFFSNTPGISIFSIANKKSRIKNVKREATRTRCQISSCS